jgi:pimeloyl-ACP methyl ester carboxylesterase
VDESRPLLVLIHGAWASSWVWDPITPALRARGYTVVAVELPGSESPEELSTIGSNVDVVSRAVGDHPGPVYLVGHSGGGITVSAAGEALADRITGAIYVAGIMLPSDVPFIDLRAQWSIDRALSGVEPYLVFSPDGRSSTVPSDAAVACLFQRAPIEAALSAARRLQPQWMAGLDIVPTWTAERFGRVRRLYIEATDDRDLPLALQRRFQERSPGAHVVTIDADHCPQLSAPDALAEAIVQFVSEG